MIINIRKLHTRPLSTPQNIEQILKSDIKNKNKRLLLVFKDNKNKIDTAITGNSL